MAISCAAPQAERRKMRKVEERDREGKVSERQRWGEIQE